MARSLVLALALVLTCYFSGNEAQALESSSPLPSPQKQQHVRGSSLRREPVERRDLTGLLGSHICQGVPAEPKSLWRMGVFDAQIEGVLLSAKTQAKELLLETAQKKARLLSRMNHMGGYAYGMCADGAKAWAVAVPSPEPISPFFEKHKIILPTAALKARCANFTIDVAADRGGLPQKVLVDKHNRVDTKSMSRGVMSVTCQPRAPSWQGPVLWALLPVTKDFDGKLPVEPSGQDRSLAEGIVHWVAKIRVKEGLSPLVGQSELSHYANLLAIDGSLRHNRNQHAFVAQKLRDTTISPIGEDRVRARDLRSMAWLLWNSPRHRGLLLDPAATAIGVGIKNLGSETLAVILTGKTDRKTTVLRQDREPGEALR